MERVVSSVGIPADLHTRIKAAAAGYTEKHGRCVSLGEIMLRSIERGFPAVEAEAAESPYIGTVYVGKFPTKRQLAALLKEVSVAGIEQVFPTTNPPTT